MNMELHGLKESINSIRLVSKRFEKLAKQLQLNFKEYQKLAEQDGYVELAKLGWYINEEIPLGVARSLMDMAIKKKNSDIDNYFISILEGSFKSRLESFEELKLDRFQIIKEAIDCHIQGKYFASTTLFLTQADGVCQAKLYKKKNENPNKKHEYIDDFIEKAGIKRLSFFEPILKALTEKSTIDEHFDINEMRDTEGLKRHFILHGVDVDYGSRVNSLKAFSLFLCVWDFIGLELLKSGL